MPAAKDVGEPGAGNRMPGSMRRREESGTNGLRAPTVLAPPADPTATARTSAALATDEREFVREYLIGGRAGLALVEKE
jgi:hypothetical protein